MTLRMQKFGSQQPWTLEEISAGFEHFYTEHKKYPSASEIDADPYLPSARTLERSFGGLVKLRTTLKLKSQNDLRSGAYSSERAHLINERAHKIEETVYEYLKGMFGKEFVHREYFFLDDKRTRADFFVYDLHKGMCIDVFYPSDRRNLIGCINSKLKKYQSELMGQYPVIFLQMNEEISQAVLNGVVANKKKMLAKDQSLMSWNTFQAFCKTRTRLHTRID